MPDVHGKTIIQQLSVPAGLALTDLHQKIGSITSYSEGSLIQISIKESSMCSSFNYTVDVATRPPKSPLSTGTVDEHMGSSATGQ